MDSSVNSLLVAQYMQDRIAEATTARSARDAKLARKRVLQLPRARRRLGRRPPASAPSIR